jgi:hypothetical protein
VTFSKSDHGIDALFEQLIDQRSFGGRAAVRRSHYDTGTSSDVIKEHALSRPARRPAPP